MNGEEIKWIAGGAWLSVVGWLGYHTRRIDGLQKETGDHAEELSCHHAKLDGIHDLLTEVRGDVKTILKNGSKE